jgi:drug/metabolite transporter (DMT)-like permease
MNRQPVRAIGWHQLSWRIAFVSPRVGSLFCAAIPMLGATRAAMIRNIEPIFGIASAALVLGESVSIIQGSGILLVPGSIILMETAKQ